MLVERPDCFVFESLYLRLKFSKLLPDRLTSSLEFFLDVLDFVGHLFEVVSQPFEFEREFVHLFLRRKNVVLFLLVEGFYPIFEFLDDRT